jgi:hypothetical protein
MARSGLRLTPVSARPLVPELLYAAPLASSVVPPSFCNPAFPIQVSPPWQRRRAAPLTMEARRQPQAAPAPPGDHPAPSGDQHGPWARQGMTINTESTCPKLPRPARPALHWAVLAVAPACLKLYPVTVSTAPWQSVMCERGRGGDGGGTPCSSGQLARLRGRAIGWHESNSLRPKGENGRSERGNEGGRDREGGRLAEWLGGLDGSLRGGGRVG